MSYSPSPRAQFDGPTHIRYENVARHLWGDETAGNVADWIYVSNGKIHQIVFGLPVGGAFRHSDSYRTIFAADEIYFVVNSTLVLANPETGEVQRARPGEAIFFRRDTWHHGFNYGSEPLRVLEFFAPPPLQGTSGAYARTKPNLTELKYAQNDLLGNWNPLDVSKKRLYDATLHLIRADEVLWRLEGKQSQILVAILVSTEHLTVGRIDLLPGQTSEPQCHGGDESLYVLEGTLNVHLPGFDGPSWFELNAGDGFYVPEGVAHAYYNISDQPARLVFGVAPNYLAAIE
jgi:quercetin dioxygenase-like cupin family protein